MAVPETQEEKDAAKVERRQYFRELFRMQGELVRLQEWVVANGHKLVILFEGRDAAGKGGVIKRITQRLNPRVCRVAALPAPNNRERTQWHFQRYAVHLPAAGEIVLFDRSWYNRAGVERVMGSAPTNSMRSSSVRCQSSRKCWSVRAFSSLSIGSPSPMTNRSFGSVVAFMIPSNSGNSAQWISNRAGAGRITQRPRKSCSIAPTFPSPLVDRAGRGQEEGPAELHPSPAQASAVSGCRARSHYLAGASL